MAAETPWIWGYCPYFNPYCTAPVAVDETTIDYSQPIALAVPTVAATPERDAANLTDRSRRAFAAGDYPKALKLVNLTISSSPSDPLLHQFRALTLYAQGEYKEAAACLYAALSAAPGWDWTTLSSFYPDAATYTEQLRSLEKYVNAHLDSADARFVLASQYLTCGYDDAAKAQLENVVKLNPKDQLSAQLLRSLTAPQTAAAATTEPAVPDSKVTVANLVGLWKAQQPDGTTIAFSLTDDSQYSWEVTRQGKTRNFAGAFTLADNILILKQGSAPAMAGQVALSPDGGLTFKLAGASPGDPGLTFVK